MEDDGKARDGEFSTNDACLRARLQLYCYVNGKEGDTVKKTAGSVVIMSNGNDEDGSPSQELKAPGNVIFISSVTVNIL